VAEAMAVCVAECVEEAVAEAMAVCVAECVTVAVAEAVAVSVIAKRVWPSLKSDEKKMKKATRAITLFYISYVRVSRCRGGEKEIASIYSKPEKNRKKTEKQKKTKSFNPLVLLQIESMFSLLNDGLISYFVGLLLGFLFWYYFGAVCLKAFSSFLDNFRKTKAEILTEELKRLEKEAVILQSKLKGRLDGEGF